MKIVIVSLVSLALSCCTLEFRDDRNTPTIYDNPGAYDAAITVYYEACSIEPYPYSPEWCDEYSDGTVCCVWTNDNWQYEEWCQWGYDACWDYNGAW